MFLKPGKQSWSYDVVDVKEKPVFEKKQQSFFCSKLRLEPIPFVKNPAIRKAQFQKFTKEKSVFADWKEDDVLAMKLMNDHDMKNWNITNFGVSD